MTAGGKPLHVKASAGTAFIQLAPSERTEPPDLRVLDPDSGLDREFTCSVEAFLPDFRNEDSSSANAKKEGDAL